MHATEKHKGFSLKMRLLSFKYAIRGLSFGIRSQHNMWIHLLAAIIAIAMGFFFGISTYEWIAIVFSIAIVLSSELINSAIEETIDLLSPDYNTRAGKIKDLAAAAVLLCAIAAAIIGFIVFLPKLMLLL